MKSNEILFSVGNYDLKINHLLIIGILSLSFSISFLLRYAPAEYGWELNEFDPFFNFRATQYLVDNGLESYLNWNDDLSWYPNGRDVAINSQVALHIFTAITYQIFGLGTTLYDFTIIFPIIIGSSTCFVIFLLTRRIFGTTSGLFSSLIFSFSFPVLLRGQIGWFKSEPLGLFLGLLAVYLFLSGINTEKKSTSLIKVFFGGLVLTTSISAWGGSQFFLIPLGIFFIVLPFFKKDHKILAIKILTFTFATMIPIFFIERLSLSYLYNTHFFTIILPTIVFISGLLIQNFSSDKFKIRNNILFIFIFFVISFSILIGLNYESEEFSFRYLNALNPFMTTENALVDSISEHKTTSIENSFIFHSILLILSGLGIWVILSKKFGKTEKSTNSLVFALILGLFGVYVGCTFIRLEIFTSVSLIILSSIFLSSILQKIFINDFSNKNRSKNILKLILPAGIIFLLIISITFPYNTSLFVLTNNPPTILNGGTSYKISSSDWLDALTWIKENTSNDSVIGSWWDYGYWIQTKSDRASLADNSTIYDSRISQIAKIFFENPDDAWTILKSMEVDYFLIFISGERLVTDGIDGQHLFILNGGGDESKKIWFAKIGNIPINKYFHSDFTSGTDEFWNNTFLGKMIPFQILGYYDPYTGSSSPSYNDGMIGIYEKQVKFEQGDPFKLVYHSSSYDAKPGEVITSVFIYEINKQYTP